MYQVYSNIFESPLGSRFPSAYNLSIGFGMFFPGDYAGVLKVVLKDLKASPKEERREKV